MRKFLYDVRKSLTTYLVQYNRTIPVLDIWNELVFVQKLHGRAVSIVSQGHMVAGEVETIVLEVLWFIQNFVAIRISHDFAA